MKPHWTNVHQMLWMARAADMEWSWLLAVHLVFLHAQWPRSFEIWN